MFEGRERIVVGPRRVGLAAADEAAATKSSAQADPETSEEEGEEKPKKSRSRSRSRSRSKKAAVETSDETDAAAQTDAETAEKTGEDADGAAGAVAAINDEVAVESPGVVSGPSAEVSEAAVDAASAEAAVATAAEPAPSGDRTASAPEETASTEAPSDAVSPEDDDPVKTIAESAGLEDETVSSDDPPAETTDATAEVDAAAAEAPADTVSEAASADTAPTEPMGMETVDLGDGEAIDAPDEAAPVEEPAPKRSRSRSRRKSSKVSEAAPETGDDPEASVAAGADDHDDDIRPVRVPRPKARKYKIQEVVKVRQIMLVQVVKEERGNKGAALTTYLSLAGRYCVLMPNTARGGGISRKITNAVDRKKLKEIAQEIDVPQGAGLIVRTAGAKRTKTEIKRDYEYLQRQWEQVRELTLKSIAPAPIYEEGNLIHRSIRDLYSREIDEVIVEGEAGYREAKDYMKLIMPSHAKNVKLHADGGLPLFAKQGVESYLSGMFNPTVQLKSGGYIVIDTTEALVAVDVNSGKSTKEGSIEDTAVKTNLEAAEEVARQAKLRDLAGLIVIDFIDMDERKNNAAVEKRMKDSLKNDRARIQIGRISSFGLLEMSRQRLRPGMLEATTQACPHCQGTGLIRSDDSVALQILRALEEEGTRKRSREVKLSVPVEVCNYLMNEKREHLASIEARYDMAVRVVADPKMIAPDYTIEKFKTATRVIPKARNVVQMDTSWTSDEDADVVEEAEVVEDEAETPEEDGSDQRAPEDTGEDGEGQPRKKRRRRSRRKKSGTGENRTDAGETDATSGESATDGATDADTAAEAEAAQDDGDGAAKAEAPAAEEAPKPKPKSRSRSRSRSRKAATPAADGEGSDGEDTGSDAADQATGVETKAAVMEPETDAPASADAPATEKATGTEAASEEKADAGPAPKKPRSRARAKAPAPAQETSPEVEAVAEIVEEATSDAVAESAEIEAATETEAAPEPDAAEVSGRDDTKPKRRGWWSRVVGD